MAKSLNSSSSCSGGKEASARRSLSPNYHQSEDRERRPTVSRRCRSTTNERSRKTDSSPTRRKKDSSNIPLECSKVNRNECQRSRSTDDTEQQKSKRVESRQTSKILSKDGNLQHRSTSKRALSTDGKESAVTSSKTKPSSVPSSSASSGLVQTQQSLRRKQQQEDHCDIAKNVANSKREMKASSLSRRPKSCNGPEAFAAEAHSEKRKEQRKATSKMHRSLNDDSLAPPLPKTTTPKMPASQPTKTSNKARGEKPTKASSKAGADSTSRRPRSIRPKKESNDDNKNHDAITNAEEKTCDNTMSPEHLAWAGIAQLLATEQERDSSMLAEDVLPAGIVRVMRQRGATTSSSEIAPAPSRLEQSLEEKKPYADLGDDDLQSVMTYVKKWKEQPSVPTTLEEVSALQDFLSKMLVSLQQVQTDRQTEKKKPTNRHNLVANGHVGTAPQQGPYHTMADAEEDSEDNSDEDGEKFKNEGSNEHSIDATMSTSRSLLGEWTDDDDFSEIFPDCGRHPDDDNEDVNDIFDKCEDYEECNGEAHCKETGSYVLGQGSALVHQQESEASGAWSYESDTEPDGSNNNNPDEEKGSRDQSSSHNDDEYNFYYGDQHQHNIPTSTIPLEPIKQSSTSTFEVSLEYDLSSNYSSLRQIDCPSRSTEGEAPAIPQSKDTLSQKPNTVPEHNAIGTSTATTTCPLLRAPPNHRRNFLLEEFDSPVAPIKPHMIRNTTLVKQTVGDPEVVFTDYFPKTTKHSTDESNVCKQPVTPPKKLGAASRFMFPSPQSGSKFPTLRRSPSSKQAKSFRIFSSGGKSSKTNNLQTSLTSVVARGEESKFFPEECSRNGGDDDVGGLLPLSSTSSV